LNIPNTFLDSSLNHGNMWCISFKNSKANSWVIEILKPIPPQGFWKCFQKIITSYRQMTKYSFSSSQHSRFQQICIIQVPIGQAFVLVQTSTRNCILKILKCTSTDTTSKRVTPHGMLSKIRRHYRQISLLK